MKTDIPYYSQIKSAIRSVRGMKWNLDFSYFRKWILVGFFLGIVAGLGAIGLFLSVELFTGIFLGLGAGYSLPYQEVFKIIWVIPIYRETLVSTIHYGFWRFFSWINNNEILAGIRRTWHRCSN